jgi:hypothetical protein
MPHILDTMFYLLLNCLLLFPQQCVGLSTSLFDGCTYLGGILHINDAIKLIHFYFVENSN